MACTAMPMEVSGDSHRNLHSKDSDCFAQVAPNVVALFWQSAGLAVPSIKKKLMEVYGWLITIKIHRKG